LVKEQFMGSQRTARVDNPINLIGFGKRAYLWEVNEQRELTIL
jgi:hypothetical protein